MPNFVTSTPHYNRRALEEYRFQLKSNKTNGKRRKIGAILDVGRLNLRGRGVLMRGRGFVYQHSRSARELFFLFQKPHSGAGAVLVGVLIPNEGRWGQMRPI